MDKQLNWGDELCGVKVTPENWVGGVIGWPDSHWYIASADFSGYHMGALWDSNGPLKDEDGAIVLDEDGDEITCPGPIFPPAGWAGKTDAELFDAVFGNPYFGTIFRYDWDWGGRQHYREVRIHISGAVNEMGPGDVDGPVKQHGSLNTFSWLDAERLARVILALQNAQVLARRLQQ